MQAESLNSSADLQLHRRNIDQIIYIVYCYCSYSSFSLHDYRNVVNFDVVVAAVLYILIAYSWKYKNVNEQCSGWVQIITPNNAVHGKYAISSIYFSERASSP